MTYYETIKTGNSTETLPPEFNWDTNTIGLVLSIFYYGGLATFTGEYIVTKLGSGVGCSLSIMLSGLTTLLHPASLYHGFYTFLACRVLTGMCESVFTVCVAVVCSKWIPQNEKSKMTSFIVNGVNVGGVTVHSLCGFLANVGGWPMIFYGTGASSIIISIVCFVVVKNDPSEDTWISEKELAYIQQGTKTVSTKKVEHPYRSILTSSPVWAFFVLNFTLIWMYTILNACLPFYVKDITGESIANVGIISSLPNTVCIFIAAICGILLDLRKLQDFSVTLLHKILISSSCLISAALFFNSVIISNFTVSIISFILVQTMMSIAQLVLLVISISLAPNSSSIIACFATFAISLSTITTRIIVGFMTTNHSLKEWNNCFILTGGISLFGAATFVLCGSSEAQPWSLAPPKQESYDLQNFDEKKTENIR